MMPIALPLRRNHATAMRAAAVACGRVAGEGAR